VGAGETRVATAKGGGKSFHDFFLRIQQSKRRVGCRGKKKKNLRMAREGLQFWYSRENNENQGLVSRVTDLRGADRKRV